MMRPFTDSFLSVKGFFLYKKWWSGK